MERYVCGYCGKSYERIEERMSCESKCSKNNSEKRRLEELSIARKSLTNLRSKESSLVAKLQATKDEIAKAEKKIKTLENMEAYATTESKGCNCKSHNIYEVNGNKVSEDEFFNQLDKLFGGLGGLFR